MALTQSSSAATGGVAAAAEEEVEAAPHPAEKEGAEGEACRQLRSRVVAAEGEVASREVLPSGGAAAAAGDACSEALPLPFMPPAPAIVTFPMEVDRDGDVPDR